MATVHYLFLGVLSLAVLAIGGFGDRSLAQLGGLGHTYGWESARAGADRGTLSPSRRADIVAIALREIGIREASGNNDGARVEEYLAYTGLGKGHAWCAAFVSWCYGRAGRAVPRTAWSPALFPIARRYTRQQIQIGSIRPADLIGIYSSRQGRIDHVGMVWKIQGPCFITIEGNVDNRVLAKRRPLATVYAFSNWVD